VTDARVDRAAAVRAAMRSLVARNGLHGTSMAAVAAEAGVATGTAYVHYDSKDELVVAAYLELKRALGAAAVQDLDPAAPPAERFRTMWRSTYEFLAAEPERARFLAQIDSSPLAPVAHARALDDHADPILVQARAPDLAAALADLPLEVLYDLGIGPAVRLAASGARLSPRQLDLVADAAWRAITRE
jgi:TetR/AcrR family transcriptional repressor of multidrug resistance operon